MEDTGRRTAQFVDGNRNGAGSGCILRMGANVCSVDTLGKTLVVAGLLIAAIGGVLWLLGHGGGGGFLPGDIVVERKHVRFYFPIVTCLVLSLVLSLIVWLLRR